MTKFKILGQEPAAVVGVVQAVLTLLLSFGLFSLTQEATGAILAAVSAALGLVAAYATRTTLLAALVGFAQAALVLAVTFGWDVSQEQQAAVLTAIAVVAGFFLREKTSSLETAVSTASPGTIVAEHLASVRQAPVPVVEVSTSP